MQANFVVTAKNESSERWSELTSTRYGPVALTFSGLGPSRSTSMAWIPLSSNPVCGCSIRSEFKCIRDGPLAAPRNAGARYVATRLRGDGDEFIHPEQIAHVELNAPADFVAEDFVTIPQPPVEIELSAPVVRLPDIAQPDAVRILLRGKTDRDSILPPRRAADAEALQ